MISGANAIQHEGRVIRASTLSHAAPELFWRAWTERDKFRSWFVDDAEGRVAPGELWTWVWNDFGFRAPYRVLEAEAPHRLVARAEAPIPGALLEVRIEGNGETEIEVINSPFGDDDASAENAAGVESGWTIALALLKRYVERYFGEPRTRVFFMQPASFEFDDVKALHRTASGLSSWLTRDGAVGEAGNPVRLTLWNGEPLSGEVLAATERETALAWDEMRGVLELKAFTAGPGQRMLAMAGSFWNPPKSADEIRELLAGRFEALTGAVASSR